MAEMSERYPHLQKKMEPLLDLPEKERIRAGREDFWVPYPKAKEILQELDDLLHHPPSVRMPNMLLCAPSNSGKSAILRRFVDLNPPDPNPEGDAAIHRVVMMEAPPKPDVLDFYGRILDAVHAPYSEKSSQRERCASVKTILPALGTRVLVVEEITHMLAGGGAHQREFRNALKSLGNELQIAIVASGVEAAMTAFASDPQLTNRFPVVTLPRWKLNQAFGSLLMSMESLLPLRERSELYGPELAVRIHGMTEGLLGEVRNLLNKALSLAIRAGDEKISLKTLEAVEWQRPADRGRKLE